MSDSIFRKKSIDKVSSPEQLNDYVKVANPGVWMLMIGIIILLFGVCIWGIVGRIDTTVNAVVISNSDQENAYLYIREVDYEEVKPGMSVSVEDVVYTIKEMDQYPINPTYDSDFTPYAIHLGGFHEEEWIYKCILDRPMEKGIYPATITVESIAPISFVLN